MKREEFIKIVKDEELLNTSEYLYEETDCPSSKHTYGCMYNDGKWIPYRTNEKAFMIRYGSYDNESDALERLLTRMRRKAELRKKVKIIDRETFLKVVEEEDLLEDKNDLYTGIDNPYVPYVYGCMYEDGKWIPYQTDERAGVWMYNSYDNESDALEDLLETLRLEARVRNSKNK